MYTGAKQGQIVYLKRTNTFDITYQQVELVRYYKDSPYVKNVNCAVVMRDNLPLNVPVKDLYRTEPKS